MKGKSLGPGDNGAAQLVRIQKLAADKLEKLSQAKLSFSRGEKRVVVRDQVLKVVKFILAFKDLISSAISAEPHTALVWAGIMVVLPVSVSVLPLKRTSDC